MVNFSIRMPPPAATTRSLVASTSSTPKVHSNPRCRIVGEELATLLYSEPLDHASARSGRVAD